MVHFLNPKHGFMNLLCISKPYVPSSLTNGKSIDNLPKMKTEPSLEDEDGSSHAEGLVSATSVVQAYVLSAARHGLVGVAAPTTVTSNAGLRKVQLMEPVTVTF